MARPLPGKGVGGGPPRRAGRRPGGSARTSRVKCFLRAVGIYLITAGGLLVVGGAAAAIGYREPILLLAIPVAPVWILAGVIVITSLAAEVGWDEDALRLTCAFGTRRVLWKDVQWHRTLAALPRRRGGVVLFALLKYTRHLGSAQTSGWAVVMLPGGRVLSWLKACEAGLDHRRRGEGIGGAKRST